MLGVGQQEEEEEQVVVHNIQGDHYQRNVLRVWVILSGPVGNPESSSVNPKSKVQTQNSWACPCRMQVWYMYWFTFILLEYPVLNVIRNDIPIDKKWLTSRRRVVFVKTVARKSSRLKWPWPGGHNFVTFQKVFFFCRLAFCCWSQDQDIFIPGCLH